MGRYGKLQPIEPSAAEIEELLWYINELKFGGKTSAVLTCKPEVQFYGFGMGENTDSSADARAQIIRDAQNTFSGPHGERMLAHLKQYFSAGKPSFSIGCNVNDALIMDGAKHVLCYIDTLLTLDPGAVARKGEDAP